MPLLLGSGPSILAWHSLIPKPALLPSPPSFIGPAISRALQKYLWAVA